MKNSSMILGIVAGVAVGAILGVLLAPDSGEKTRKKIASKGQGVADDLKSRYNSLVDGFNEQKEELMSAKNKMADTVRKVTS